MIFAEVIVDISVKSLDRPFQYRVPEELKDDVVIGTLVVIPFGKGNREMKGYVIGLSDTPQYDINRTKSILRVEKQGVVAESHLLSLAYWIKENYGSTMNDAIKAVMPVRREIKEKVERSIFPKVSYEELQAARNQFEQKHNAARVRLLDAILQKEDAWENGLDYDEAVKKWKVTGSVIQSLTERELITVAARQLYRNPVTGKTGQSAAKILNRQQQAIVDAIGQDMEQGCSKNYLIHGVTGSGKTEVYMSLIEKVLRQGKQAIVLIPEIALTFQNVNRFYARFGDKVSIMHSKLSSGERYDQFTRAKRGEIQIMIGPRSALFTPFANLGLIIIDEEHESSYQSDNPPKYHAREVAIQRAKMLHASVVLGSATPSLEAYYRCQTGEYQLFTLTERAGQAILPEVTIVDLRQELAAKNFSIFSRILQEKIEQRLQKREQIMLFINRRGYAGFVSCRQCGEVIRCENCSVSMKPHEYRGQISVLKCHYCGAQKPMPKTCPSCGSKYIGTFGLGTQQVEDMVRKRFPQARVLRMDADTTAAKEGHEKILKEFANHQADILVGTQMIVKGHDFENVTLVGALAADLSLNADDYRSSERTFQLLAQAAGRAGRGQKKGEVIFQTYQPEHYSIQCAAKEDYVSFYHQELAVRQMLHYPPISNILEVLAFSENQAEAVQLSEDLRRLVEGMEDIILLGPADAPIAKLRNLYRRRLFIKAKKYQTLCDVKNRMEAFMKDNETYKNCRITFDFNR
ncbi:MAG: primosomal protein N' [Butyribacter sp.]|nr:primosomal protein N' [bacterium]MDY3855140.1 primosomal protein N' [Butyribacter sp.]